MQAIEVYITFSLYLLLMLGIGVKAYFSTKNLDDYILGGRRLGSFVTAMAAGASDMSGWLLMGLPSAIYLGGLAQSWLVVGLLVGAYLNWWLVAKRLRVFTEYCGNALTLPDYFHHRFAAKTKAIKVATAAIILFFFTIYCAGGVVSGARLFESLFNMNYHQALYLGAAATIIYTFIGGFLAVSWTDTIQATLMIFALLLAPVMVYLQFGGWVHLQETLTEATIHTNVSYNTFWQAGLLTIVGALAWGLGYFGQPHIITRFMAVQNVRSLTKARRIAITWMALCMGGAVAVGYFGRAYFTLHPTDEFAMLDTTGNINTERIFIALSQILFNPWLVGVVLSAILAAVMSTLSAQLLVASSAVTEDFYKGVLRPGASSRELMWVGRVMILLISAIAIAIAYNPQSKVLSLVANAWAGFGASFGPVVLLSLLWSGTSLAGAVAGMVVGAITVIGFKPLTGSNLYEMVPAFTLSTLAVVVVSLVWKPSQRAVIRFVKAQRAYLKLR